MLTSEEVSKIERDFADGDTGWMGDRASLRALLTDRAEMVAEIERLQGVNQTYRILVEALREENGRLRAVLTFCTCGFNCVYYPDQDHDHPGIQYPHCVDPDIECPVADALAALEARHADE